ncbi:cell division protein Fic [Clostridia bacterium]|nr:cell division protein Fic [Clostridia bacterium]
MNGYKPLYKLYYSDKNRYGHIYRSRKDSRDCAELPFSIVSGDGGDKFGAFFMTAPEVSELCGQIDKVNSLVSGTLSQMHDIGVTGCINHGLSESVFSTLKIEGIRSTVYDIHDYLNNRKRNERKDSNIGKIKGIIDCCRESVTAGVEVPYDVDSLKAVHEKLLKGDRKFAGKLRKCKTRSSVSEKKCESCFYEDCYNFGVWQYDRLRHRAVPAKDLQKQLVPLFDILKSKDLNPYAAASIAHYLVEYIHPFYDGNGRLGRFVMSLALLKAGINRITALDFNNDLEKDRNGYYKALEATESRRNRGDVTPFVLFCLDKMYSCVRRNYNTVAEYLRKERAVVNELSAKYGFGTASPAALVAVADVYEVRKSACELSEYLSMRTDVFHKIIANAVRAGCPITSDKQGGRIYYSIDSGIFVSDS